MRNSVVRSLLAGLLSTLTCDGASVARLTQEPEGSFSVKLLNQNLLSSRIEPELQTDRVFNLRSAEGGDLTIAPVYFDEPDNAQPAFQCGIFFVPKQGAQSFVMTIGPDAYEDCEGFEALGTMSDGGPRPRLIAIYSTSSFHGDQYTEPYVLSWNAEKKLYEINHEQTEWVGNRKIINYTVPIVRHLLSKRFPTQVQRETLGK